MIRRELFISEWIDKIQIQFNADNNAQHAKRIHNRGND